MEIVIKKPTIGEIIESEELGITGDVIDILDYDACVRDTDFNLRKLLEKKLGEDYRGKYFEVFIEIIETKTNEYRKNDIAVLDWEEYQKCKIIK